MSAALLLCSDTFLAVKDVGGGVSAPLLPARPRDSSSSTNRVCPQLDITTTAASAPWVCLRWLRQCCWAAFCVCSRALVGCNGGSCMHALTPHCVCSAPLFCQVGSFYNYGRLAAAGWILTTVANFAITFLLGWRPRKVASNSGFGK